jgi:hypothetical protein
LLFTEALVTLVLGRKPHGLLRRTVVQSRYGAASPAQFRISLFY